jgi:hypothetical protein
MIELLLVISIIVFLIAMTLPAIGRAREQARRAICGYNIREIGASVHSFANDHAGKAPIAQVDYDGSGLGVYAFYGRTWAVHPDHGRFRGLGILTNESYLEPKAMYCPSWSYGKIGVYVTEAPSGQGGGWFKEPDLPAGQQWMQSTYAYRGSFDAPKWRPAELHNDDPESAIAADQFSDPTRGVDFHHIDGYMVAFLDGHGEFYPDPDHYVRDYNGGLTYHAGSSNYELQEQVWSGFFVVR